MRIFQTCLRNNCEKLRFRYEQQSSLYQHIHQVYTQCVEDKFRQGSLFFSGNSQSNSQDNEVIIGDGVVVPGKPLTIMKNQLSNVYDQIIQIYDNCFKSYGQNSFELDHYKDCQINCLDDAISQSERTSTSSTTLIFSLIGFGLVLLSLYKCDQIRRKKREHAHQLQLDEEDEHNQQYQIDEEQDHQKQDQQYLYKKQQSKQNNIQMAKNNKLPYRKPGGLSRLNVDKMKEIVNHLKNENPETNQNDQIIEEVGADLKIEEGKDKSSTFIDQQTFPKIIIENINKFNSSNQYTSSQFTSSQYQFLSTSSAYSQKTGSIITQEQMNTLNHYNFSPKQAQIENNNQSQISQVNLQKQQTQEKQDQSKDCSSNDKTQPFSCYDQYYSYTQPCEAQSKYIKHSSPEKINNSQKLENFLTEQTPKTIQTEESSQKSKQVSPISLNSQTKSNQSPLKFSYMIQSQKNQITKPFEQPQLSVNKFSHEQQQSHNQIQESSTQMLDDEEGKQYKSQNNFGSNLKNNSVNSAKKKKKLSNQVKTKSLFEMNLEDTNIQQKIPTFSLS